MSNDDDTAKLATAVAALDPHVDAHWNSEDLPNCNFLSTAVGFQVTKSTLLANALMRRRDDDPTRKSLVTDDTAAAAAAAAATGSGHPPPENPPDTSRTLPQLDTFNQNTTFHRNKRALELVRDNAQGIEDVLAQMTRMSGDVEAARRGNRILNAEAKRLLIEIERRAQT